MVLNQRLFNDIPIGERDTRNLIEDLSSCAHSNGRLQYAICSPDKASEVKEVVTYYSQSYCSFDIEENLIGLVFSESKIFLNVGRYYSDPYNKEIIAFPELMEDKCKELADEARRIAKCNGRFVQDWP